MPPVSPAIWRTRKGTTSSSPGTPREPHGARCGIRRGRWEWGGRGSIPAGDGPPSIHLHSSLGRGKEVLTGCLRKEGEAFIVVEAMILEVLAVRATRSPDERSGLELLTLE